MAGSPAARARARAAAVEKALGRTLHLVCGHDVYRDRVIAWKGSRAARFWYCDECDEFYAEVKTRYRHPDTCAGCWRCSEEPPF